MVVVDSVERVVMPRVLQILLRFWLMYFPRRAQSFGIRQSDQRPLEVDRRTVSFPLAH